ncbi:MAG TPA: GNAT family N-acetyltransferase [Acidimicrobiia bacterium]|nr:GNAT family N-acetyltransferase [Acidimicrobiia bacterium]
MKSGCFACDVVLEADDSEAVADLFIAHAAETHEWDYPEEALRNYARNAAEAVERVSNQTERLESIGEITVERVTDERVGDWLELFDHTGFAGNPDWASCYCRELHEPPGDDMPERLWTENRAAMVDRLRNRSTVGYLAYVDGTVAGWVNASQTSDYALIKLLEPDGPEPEAIVGVSCFVIAPPYRRHGVATALLDHVIADAPSRGASWVEAYPRNDPGDSDGGHFHGPRSMYDKRGFEPLKEREKDTVVRLPVA